MVINRKGNMDNSWLDDYFDDEGHLPEEKHVFDWHEVWRPELPTEWFSDKNGDTLIKAIQELKAERRSLPSTLRRLKAERHFWYNKSLELNRKWLSLFHNSGQYTMRGHVEGRLVALDKVRGHVEGRLVALDKDIRRTKESTYALDTVFREFQVLRKNLQERNLKSELRNRIEFIRLIKIVICLLYALLNRSGRQRHGSQCDLGTILILLIRSGVEANPGPGPPRNWKDLPTTVRHLGILSSYIANGWEYYGDRLGLKEEDRDVIVAKYKHTQAQIYHMLKRAAIIPGNQSMRRLLMILEECEEEYIDMCITWDRLEFYFAEEEEEIQVAVQGSVERDGEDQNGSSSRGRKRISNFGQGESSVKVQRI